MGACCCHVEETPSPPIPQGMIRICVAGGGPSPHVGRARAVVAEITKAYPDKYESWFYFTSPGLCPCGDGYYSYIQEKTKNVKFPEHLKGHSTMPLVWLEESEEARLKEQWTVLGGRQELCDWAEKEFPNDKEIIAAAKGFSFGTDFGHACCCCKIEDNEKNAHLFSTCLRKRANYNSTNNNTKKNTVDEKEKQLL